MNQNNSKGMGIAALVCGILGIVGGLIPYVGYFTFILSILGVVFGAISMKKLKATGQSQGLAIAGLVLGIVGCAFSLIGAICYSCILCTACSSYNSLASLAAYY